MNVHQKYCFLLTLKAQKVFALQLSWMLEYKITNAQIKFLQKRTAVTGKKWILSKKMTQMWEKHVFAVTLILSVRFRADHLQDFFKENDDLKRQTLDLTK